MAFCALPQRCWHMAQATSPPPPGARRPWRGTHSQLWARRRCVSRVRRAVNRAMGKRADHSTISRPPTDGCSGLSHPLHWGVNGDGCSHRPAAHSTYHIRTRLPRKGDASPTRCNKLQCCLGAFITSHRRCPPLGFSRTELASGVSLNRYRCRPLPPT